jgi:chromate reductase, NAD(P)H dehydrogenase (quinone)
MKKIKIVTLSGSLRPQSSSHKILQIATTFLPDNVEIDDTVDIGSLPHFDGSETRPPTVAFFLQQLQQADGILICIPEYAFGVPGAFKNALDWTVGGGEFSQKPVAYITAASVGEKAHEALGYVLTALGSVITASLRIPFIRAKLTPEGIIKDPALKESVRTVVDALIHTVQEKVNLT